MMPRSAALAAVLTGVVCTVAIATPAAAHPERPHRTHTSQAAKRSSKARSTSHASKTHSAKAHTATTHSAKAHAAAAREKAHHTSRAARRRHERTDDDAPAPHPALAAIPTVPTIDLGAGAPAPALAAPAAANAAPASAPTMLAASIPAGDSLAGRSGKLRARFVVATANAAHAVSGAARSVASYFPYLRRLFGDSAARVTPDGDSTASPTRPTFAFITMLPFSQKIAGRIGSYNMGYWPGEGSDRADRYRNPTGFIEVTAANQATPISEHFTLGDFLTHDQRDVWPKYLVLHEQLLDKLELVLDDLRAHGYKADRLHVMSGFRTPQYNKHGGDPSGRAELSRHQYGDAADVWVENGNGVMADLNGDGRIDARDAAVLAAAAERVEQAHPDLIGGVGIYHGNRAHGPFVHIDTRGIRARWGNG